MRLLLLFKIYYTYNKYTFSIVNMSLHSALRVHLTTTDIH